MVKQDDKFEIISNNIVIDMSKIEDQKTKSDILSYFNYINEDNYELKRDTLTSLINKLESKREDIVKLFGKGIDQALFMYGNNLNLRHDNVSITNKSKYKPAVARLTQGELIEWYDYIYPLAINTYSYLNKLKNVNFTGDFK
jgi:hypothetical protein